MRIARIRLGVTVLVAGVLATCAAVVHPAHSATTTPTISGPATVYRGTVVPVSGTTPQPAQTVDIYFHKKNTVGYVKRRELTSDSAGRFITSYVADTDYRYYAVVDGVSSNVALTQLTAKALVCSTSGPAFPASPFGEFYSAWKPVSSLQVTNGAGLWAGYASLNNDAIVYTWSTTTHRMTILGRYRYTDSFAPGEDGSVQVKAVTRGGSVLAYLQRTNGHFNRDGIGVVYMGGRRYTLKGAADWNLNRPLGITSSGSIISEVEAGARRYVVSYANALAPYRVLARNVGGAPIAMDGAGDIAYQEDGSVAGHIRYANGVQTTVDALGFAGGTAGTVLIGYQQGLLVSWDTRSGTPPQSRVLAQPPGSVEHVGPNGTMVTYTGSRYLRTATGGVQRLPGMADGSYGIAASGTVAYPAAADGLPRFLSCH